MPEPHLANWEERLHEDEVYVMLYLDSREELADQLTEAERQQILSEFDAIDSQMVRKAMICGGLKSLPHHVFFSVSLVLSRRKIFRLIATKNCRRSWRQERPKLTS